jgi:hypothetical protein
VLVLLVGARVPARAEGFPPAWVEPGAGPVCYYPAGWHSPVWASQAALAPAPAVARATRPPPEAVPLLTAPAAEAAIVACSAVEAPDDADDSVPAFAIQFRTHGRDEMSPGGDGDEAMPSFLIQLQPPGPERLFRVESESAFQERIRQSTPRRPFEPVIFPTEPVISTSDEPPVRAWPPRPRPVEPNYVCYGPLFFQQKYAERYGWDLGVLSPFLALGAFWYDGLTFPYHLLTVPYCGSECGTGYCLPGDPTPLRLDPPHWPTMIFEVSSYHLWQH